MSGKKRILVVCGSGIATSTVVAGKIRELLSKNGLEADLKQCLAAEAVYESRESHLIVATTQLPASIPIPVISGLPFLTGIGVDRVALAILEAVKR